jgi:hypothetical protein
MLCEHMKKMIIDKKATLPFCTNFLANYFSNFKTNDSSFTKLLGILEKRLNQKGKSQDLKMVNNTYNNFGSKNFLLNFLFFIFYFIDMNNTNSNRSFNNITPQNRINYTSINDSNYNTISIRDNKSIKTSTNRENIIKESKDNIFNDYE